MSAESALRRVLRALRARRYSYERLVEVRISRARLLDNLRQFRQHCAPRRIAPVLKSNAYGHGLVEVARILEGELPPFLVVDGYHEALILRNEGIRARILVIGYSATENIARSRLRDVAFTIFDVGQLCELSRAQPSPRHIHLKIDTGLRRHGVASEDVAEALAIVKGCAHLVLEGVCSHFADAAGADETFTLGQISRWRAAMRVVREFYPDLAYQHLANTAGSFWALSTDANVVRLGIGLYGFDSSPRRQLPLEPALSIVSRVSAIKQVPKGSPIGYRGSYTAAEDMVLATTPSGYNSCVDARLSNKGAFLIGATPRAIIGRVSMNSTSVDVGAPPEVRRGDEVVIISAQKGAINSVESMARLCETSPYVILAGLSSRLRRVVE